MSSADWLFVAAVATFVTALLCADWLRTRRDRRADQPCPCPWCTQARERRRDRDLERLP